MRFIPFFNKRPVRDISLNTNEGGPDPQEKELLRRARNGDRSAVGELIRTHEGLIYRFLLSRTQDEDQAADLAQETFVKALRSLEAFRGESTFRTWLLAIARNEFRAAYRKGLRRKEQSLDTVVQIAAEGFGPEDEAVRDSEIERIRRQMDTLPEKQRLSVSLRLFDGLSFREIGVAIGSTEGAARVNFHHGIRKLREWLEHDE
ncbi:MAG: RNA polymerase sigma factor [Gemmatimonadales bacterium]|nr:MAG: RNA polymerase sigma factor [Gemmatimonadales bacterium]